MMGKRGNMDVGSDGNLDLPIAECDKTPAGNDDPMLVPMVMKLKAQPMARLDPHAFDPMGILHLENVERSPGAHLAQFGNGHR